jgi:hypothetical protein
VGEPDVEIPESSPASKARRKMDADGQNLQAASLTAAFKLGLGDTDSPASEESAE